VTPQSTRWRLSSFSGKFRAAPMRVFALLVPAFLAVVMASACSNQGEGDFCDPNNGNNDCNDGLECVPAPGLSGGIVNRNRCCPIAPAQPTTSACSLNTSTVIEAGTEVPDAFALGVPDAEAGAAVEAGSPDATVAADAGTTPLPDAGADTSPE
jgi:hypothetical protein